MPEFHPITLIFPLLEGDELDALARDIAENGPLEPISLDPTDGLIVDGRNRWRACQIAGVEPDFHTLKSGQSITGFIISKNRLRPIRTKAIK
jgi:hypothetical protein